MLLTVYLMLHAMKKTSTFEIQNTQYTMCMDYVGLFSGKQHHNSFVIVFVDILSLVISTLQLYFCMSLSSCVKFINVFIYLCYTEITVIQLIQIHVHVSATSKNPQVGT